MNFKNDKVVVAITLFFVVSITYYLLLDGQNVFISADTLSPTAIKNAIKNSVEKYSVFPLWSPWIFSGLPTTHSLLNISDYYYPHKIIELINYLNIPWIWNFLLHLIFGGFGMYNLVRYFGNSKYSAYVISSSFIMMPYMTAMTVHGHGSQMMTACYIPWIILFLFRLSSNLNLINCLMLSLLIGLQLQRGHIQIAYYTWMIIGLYFVVSIIMNYKDYYMFKINFIKKYLLIVSSMLLGTMMSLNIYLPVLNYAPHSIRGANDGGAGISYATQWSFSFKEMLTFIIPSSLGFGGQLYWGNMPFTDYPNYTGIIIIIFAILGFLKSNINRNHKILFSLIIIFSLLLSFGKNLMFFYEMFYNWMPLFNKFRSPVFILILFNFSIYIYSSFGIDYFFENFKNKHKNKLFLKVISAFLFFNIFIYFTYNIFLPTNINLSKYRLLLENDLFSISIILILLLLTYLSIIRNVLSAKIVKIILFILVCYDFTRVNHEIISPKYHIPNKNILNEKEYLDKYLTKDSTVKLLNEDYSKFRIFDAIGNQNRWSVFDIENVNGYHPAKLNLYNDMIEGIRKNGYNIWPIGILKMLNVKYLILPESNFTHPDFINIGSSSMYYFGPYEKYDGELIQMNVFELKESLPRLYFVENLSYMNNVSILDEIINNKFNPIKQSYTSNDIAIDGYQFNIDNADVVLNSWTPNELRFTTNTSTNQFLVISEIFYPYGWSVVDNKDKTYEIYKVNESIRGIFVPKGEYHFKMIFNPKDVKVGSTLSFSAFFLILILLFYECIIRQKKNR